MTGRERLISGGAGMAGKPMSLGISNVSDDPFPVAVLQGVLHDHTLDARIGFRMYRNGGVRHTSFEGDCGCRYVQGVYIQSATCLQTVYDRLLNLFLGPDSRSARQQEGHCEAAAEGT